MITLEELKKMDDKTFLDYCLENGVKTPSSIFIFLCSFLGKFDKQDPIILFLDSFKDSLLIKYMDWGVVKNYRYPQLIEKYPDIFPDDLLDDISLEDWKILLVSNPLLFHKFKKTIYIEKMGIKILNHNPQIKMYL
jgi:hypothetical protein